MRSIGSCRARGGVLAITGLACLLVLTWSARTAPAADRVPGAGVADLAERLTVGLRVQAPDDVAFCEAVARHVIEGRLPRQLVDGTYAWSLQRGKKYPFPAFAHVIKIKAARLGVTL